MKKILKNPLFMFALGAMIFSGITGVVAYSITSNDVGYTPSNNTWDVDNVKDAVDDLYSKIDEKIIINTFGEAEYRQSVGDAISNRSTSIELSRGKYIVNVINTLSSSSSTSIMGNYEFQIDIICSTCTKAKISGYGYNVTATGTMGNSGLKPFSISRVTTYYIEINNSETIETIWDEVGPESSIGEVVALQVIPIN